MMLYLIRHGETDWNRDKRFQSRTDVPLNETGRAQARAVRQALLTREVRFGQAYCSPLGRAVETARIILEESGLAPVPENALLEVDLGDFEGRLESELREEFGAAYDEWRGLQYTVAAPGGESIIDAAGRVAPFVEQLRRRSAGQPCLIVAHQGINMALKVAISGQTDVISAATFRQNNDEVDVWDLAAGARADMFRIRPE